MAIPLGKVILSSQKDGSLLTALNDQDGGPVGLLPGDPTGTIHTNAPPAMEWIVTDVVDMSTGSIAGYIIRTAQADSLCLAASSNTPMSPVGLHRTPTYGLWALDEQGTGLILQLTNTPFAIRPSLQQNTPQPLVISYGDPTNTIIWTATPAT